MIIAIDYDKTFTADPKLFNNIMKIMSLAGHRVIICTMRYDYNWEANEVLQIFKDSEYEIFFTNRKAKKNIWNH